MGGGVVSDASPLIALEQIGRLSLLERLFAEVVVPPAVEREVAPPVGIELRPCGGLTVRKRARPQRAPGATLAAADEPHGAREACPRMRMASTGAGRRVSGGGRSTRRPGRSSANAHSTSRRPGSLSANAHGLHGRRAPRQRRRTIDPAPGKPVRKCERSTRRPGSPSANAGDRPGAREARPRMRAIDPAPRKPVRERARPPRRPDRVFAKSRSARSTRSRLT